MSTTGGRTESTKQSATGTAVDRPAWVRGIYVLPTATGGSVVLRDGGSGGSVELDVDTPADATTPFFVPIAGEGLRFGTDVHVTLTDVASVTVLFRPAS